MNFFCQKHGKSYPDSDWCQGCQDEAIELEEVNKSIKDYEEGEVVSNFFEYDHFCINKSGVVTDESCPFCKAILDMQKYSDILYKIKNRIENGD